MWQLKNDGLLIPSVNKHFDLIAVILAREREEL